MSEAPAKPQLAADIRWLLSGLRWRIRAYVWLEGLSLAAVWIAATFWLALALDYLPVRLGASEMPQAARAVLLALMVLGLIFVLYRWILRRAFVRLGDQSMAVILERRFDGFHDSLLTSVEMATASGHAVPFSPEMLSRARQEALQQTGDVVLRQVFNFFPLVRNVSLAVLLVLPTLLLFAGEGRAFDVAVRRLYLLDDQPWPRRARLEVVGVEVVRKASLADEVQTTQMFEFAGREMKLARGSSARLRVRADVTADMVPEVCTIYYRTEEGDRGRANMRKVGQPRRDGYQYYVFDGKPFNGILSSLRFDVLGHDFRLRDFHVQVVDSPTIVETKLDCVFPEYMVDTELSLWLPRTIDLTTATQLPQGTELTVRARTNKQLTRVDVYSPVTDRQRSITFDNDEDARQFEFFIPSLDESLNLEVTLHDTDGVVSDAPERIFVAAIEDQPPRVDVLLSGIGTAIAPDARLPVRGGIGDDYAVAETWFHVQVEGREPLRHGFEADVNGETLAAIDFRELRTRDKDPFELMPGEKLVLGVQASDKCDLGAGPNVGGSDRFQLDVVTPDELLAMLESREASLRQRFEQIVDETTQMRDSLLRVRARDEAASDSGSEPDDTPVESAEPGDAEDADRARTLRLLRVQRAAAQSQKSAQEVLGVAASFRDIRDELINNRIDSKDRTERLEKDIVEPLAEIGGDMFTELDSRLEVLQAKLDDVRAGRAAAQKAVEQADTILLEMNAVLEKMLKFETFSELLDIVRGIIKEQEDLSTDTKKVKEEFDSELLGDLLQ